MAAFAGPMVRIRLPPAVSLSHRYLPWLRARRPGVRRECEPRRDQRMGRAGHEPARLLLFSLTGIDPVPLGKSQRQREEPRPLGRAHSVEGGSSACQEAALI